jgi:hypothetical protein
MLQDGQYSRADFVRTQRLPILSCVQHSNVAAIYDIYSYGNKVFSIIEPLEISFAELEVQKYRSEEWEIATIIMEVLYSLQARSLLIIAGHKRHSLSFLAEDFL